MYLFVHPSGMIKRYSIFLLKEKRLFLTTWGKIEALMLDEIVCFLLASKFQNKVIKKKNLIEDANLFIIYGASYSYF